MASVEELLLAVSGIVGALGAIAGSIVTLLSYWANRRPRHDLPGRRRLRYADRARWLTRRWVGICLACLGFALVIAVAFWDPRPAVAASFAVGLTIGSTAALAISWRTKRTGPPSANHQIADSNTSFDRAENSEEIGLVCERDEASVRLERGSYHVHVRRWLVNQGSEPITEFPISLTVDRHPAQLIKSRSLYQQNPLLMDELRLTATLDGRPISWKVTADYNAQKDISLRFEDNDERLPLYPGQRALLEYRYSVGIDKWGPWFARSIQHPTRAMQIEVRLPARLTPKVWGTIRNTLTEPEKTIDITRAIDGEFVLFRWETVDPCLFALIQIRWELTYAADRKALDH